MSARDLEPHRLTYYVHNLASLFHAYYNLGSRNPELRVVTQDNALTHARLLFVAGIQVVLQNVLNLLGVSAPERM